MRAQFPVAVHIFLLRGEEVLLLLRSNTGYEDGRYSVVAGHLDGGESVTEAAMREAREEVGIALAPADLEVVGVMHRKAADERIDFFLVARAWQGTPANCEPDKCAELRWAPIHALPEAMVAYVRDALSNYRDGVWFEEHGWHPSAGRQRRTIQTPGLGPTVRN